MAARARAVTVLYDGTASADRALDAAARLLGYGSTLTVVGVEAAGARENGGPPSDLARDVRARLARHQVLAEYVDGGDAPAALVRDHATDLLVVGRGSPAAVLAEGEAGASADVLLVR